jgi:hypothetical protein
MAGRPQSVAVDCPWGHDSCHVLNPPAPHSAVYWIEYPGTWPPAAQPLTHSVLYRPAPDDRCDASMGGSETLWAGTAGRGVGLAASWFLVRMLGALAATERPTGLSGRDGRAWARQSIFRMMGCWLW